MIIGIGTDLCDIERIEAALNRYGERFARRILVDSELVRFQGHAKPAGYLAKRFAAKEAFSKAWGTGIGEAVGWHDVAVAHDARGKPLIAPSSAMAEKFATEKIVATHISLSDEDDHALAFVVLEKNPT